MQQVTTKIDMNSYFAGNPVTAHTALFGSSKEKGNEYQNEL